MEESNFPCETGLLDVVYDLMVVIYSVSWCNVYKR